MLETNPIVNPNQPSNFTCHVFGDPPPNPRSVSLYHESTEVTDATGITQRRSTTTGFEVAVVFDVEKVLNGGFYSCILTEGGKIATLKVESTTYGNFDRITKK